MKELKAFRLDKNLLDKLQDIALKENRSLSNVVETLLKDKVSEKNSK